MVAAAIVASGVIGVVGTNMAASSARSATGAGTQQGIQSINQTTNQALRDVKSATNTAVNTETAAGKSAVGGFKPFEAGGTAALGKLETLLGLGKGGNAAALKSLESSPGYQFAQQQGDQATINAATATGMNLSGNTLKGLSEFNQGLATQTFQNDVGNLENLVGTGLSATSGASAAGLQAGGTVAGLEAGAGNTEAQLLSDKGTAVANTEIGQGTNLANISMAQGASNSAIAGNVSNDFLLANLAKSSDGYDSDFLERHSNARTEH